MYHGALIFILFIWSCNLIILLRVLDPNDLIFIYIVEKLNTQ